MAGQVVQMDYAVIGEVSKGFSTSATALRTIAKILQALVQTLRAMAFASMGTSLALAKYYDTIRQKVENLSKLCEEFSGDLAQAINDHKKGDIKGKRYFGEGISR